MAIKILNDVTIQSRVDTLANWVNKNPVLANGELALVKNGNTIEIRVGDGVTNFSGLAKLDSLGFIPYTKEEVNTLIDGVGSGVEATEVMIVVNHGTMANAARPLAGAVYWIGSVEPINAIDEDLWVGEV